MRRLDDSRLIALIRTGGDAGLEAMYLQYRDEFLGWGRRFLKADEDELASVYTDTCIAACENVRSGKYAAAGNVKFRSYLFQIARNKHLNLQRSRKNDPLARTVEDIFGKNERGIDREEDMDSDEVRMTKNGIVRDVVFNEMTEPCLSLFRYIYYEHRKGKDVAELMSYKNADTVKSQTARCRKKLGEVLRVKFKNAGLI